MIKKLLALLLLLFLITSLLMACDNDEKVDDQPKATEATDNQPQSIGIMKGVNLAPKSWDDDDYLDFIEKAKQTGEIVTWAGDWDELGREEGG
ncbi:MAG: hypothetical protein HOC20_09995, partial [Chloroflexi bacterium]|nr:hypothetical protein [Chloroflexota bacterium]